MSPHRSVLIVDDDPILREIMSARLAQSGFAVCCVKNGEEACFRLDAERYALALVDLNMPKLDGFGLLRRIRRHRHTLDLPVIVVTANDGEGSIEEAYRLGASSFITKPVNWSQFEAPTARPVRTTAPAIPSAHSAPVMLRMALLRGDVVETLASAVLE